MKYLLILLTLCCAIVRSHELHSPIRSSEFKDDRYKNADDMPMQRSLLRSNNVKDIDMKTSKETSIPVVVTSPLNQQIWIGPTKFNEAIEKGLSNV